MSMPAPAPAITPGLDFSNVSYKKDPLKKFAEQTKLARQIIQKKLPAFEELQSAFKVTLADGDLVDDSIWIDARLSPAQLLTSAPVGDPALSFETVLTPEQVQEIYTGFGEDVQTTIMMTGKHKGNILHVMRFADLLTPNPTDAPTTAKELNLDELPKPTEDIQQVKTDIRRWGYGLLKNALSPEQVTILKKAVQEQAAGERNAGTATFDGGANKPNQRVWNLYNKGDDFADLMNHPLIDEIVPWYIGDDPLLWSYNANIARPGGQPQVLHYDSGIMGAGRSKPVAINISWLLCDVTEKNGGTRIFPGSHNKNVRPRNIFSSEGSIAAEAPAGTALIFEGRIWHGTGKNQETSGERPVILSLFCNKGVRPKENALLSLNWEVEDNLSERHKSLCALRTTMAGVGGHSGESRAGILLRRPRGDEHKLAGKTRAPHDDDEVARMIASGSHANTEATKAREASSVDQYQEKKETNGVKKNGI